MKTVTLALLLALGCAILIAKKHMLYPNSAKLLAEILERRHSGYAYDPQKKIPESYITSLVHAAQLTPSCYNEQPWNFIICDKLTNLESYNKVLSTLVEFNQNWAKNAQLLVVIAATQHSKKNNELNAWAGYDTGAAAMSMAIQATALGLMTHQMGGFDAKKLAVELNLPETVVPMSVMAIGYEDKSHPHAKPRQRKSIHENFFFGAWGKTK